MHGPEPGENAHQALPVVRAVDLERAHLGGKALAEFSIVRREIWWRRAVDAVIDQRTQLENVGNRKRKTERHKAPVERREALRRKRGSQGAGELRAHGAIPSFGRPGRGGLTCQYGQYVNSCLFAWHSVAVPCPIGCAKQPAFLLPSPSPNIVHLPAASKT